MYYQLSKPKYVVQNSISITGSKSISNRLLVLQQLSNSRFQIQNVSDSDDTQLLQQFFSVYPQQKTFNVHNAGTVARFLTAFLAIQPGKWTLHCDEAMKKRPIKILVDALHTLGANITYLEKDGFLPLQIVGNSFHKNSVDISASVSSQYISALMLIGPQLKNGLQIQLKGEIASFPYLKITESIMQQCGYSVQMKENNISIEPGQNPSKKELTIFNESDWSSAAFYYTIAALRKDAKITLSSFFTPENSLQGDAQVVHLFKQLGVATHFTKNELRLSNTNYCVSELSANFYDRPDMVPAVAIACAALGVVATFTGVENLVIKESNRLKALQTELKKVGIQFQEINNSTWKLFGEFNEKALTTTVFKTYNDHRMAMSLACLGFVFDGVKIDKPQVVNKSYRNFWEDLQTLGLEIEQHY